MEPDLGNIKKKIEDSRDLLDRITMKLPGFKGYVEKAEMYDADSIVRSFMSDSLMRCKKTVNRVMSDMQKKAQLKLLPELDSLSLVLERVVKKCRYADYGASSFSRVKITPEDQERILLYDWNLLSELEDVEKFIELLRKSNSDGIIEVVYDGKASFSKQDTAETASTREEIESLEKDIKDIAEKTEEITGKSVEIKSIGETADKSKEKVSEPDSGKSDVPEKAAQIKKMTVTELIEEINDKIEGFEKSFNDRKNVILEVI